MYQHDVHLKAFHKHTFLFRPPHHPHPPKKKGGGGGGGGEGGREHKKHTAEIEENCIGKITWNLSSLLIFLGA